MKYITRTVLMSVSFFITFMKTQAAPFLESPLEGKWDITIHSPAKDLPAWLGVSHSGFRTLVGEIVAVSGSARPISKIDFDNGHFHFSVPPQWEQGTNDLVVDGELKDEKMVGTIIFPDGRKMDWAGVRAPALRHSATVIWDKSISLFNGKDLTGWHAMGPNQWIAENNVLKSPKSGSNLVTDASFSDFKLHIEFRYPKGSNSGVYLRGRYEVQIEDSYGMEPLKDQLGSIYGFIAPNENPAKKADEWQEYDITLVGRLVTIVANGKTVICSREIPGITGGALNSNEGEPGPLLIQGDHGPIEFRNIVLTPAK